MSERRFESRFLCAELVRLDFLAGEDECRTVEAVLEDISALGVCVQVEEKIALGSTATISVREMRFSGYVSYCVFRDYGYFVGIRLSDETQWSADMFQPRHLTNLEALAHEAEAVPPPDSGTVH